MPPPIRKKNKIKLKKYTKTKNLLISLDMKRFFFCEKLSFQPLQKHDP